MVRHTPTPDPSGFHEPDLYRFWFLCPANPSGHTEMPEHAAPAIGFDLPNGLCWTEMSPHTVVLIDEYNRVERQVDALISAVCPPAF